MAEIIPFKREDGPAEFIARLLKVADDLGEVTDSVDSPNKLALIMEGIKEVRRILAIHQDEIESRLAYAMGDRKMFETKFGSFERERGKKRTKWEPEIRQRTLADVLVNEGLVEPEQGRQTAIELLEGLPFTPGAPRITKVVELGYDPGEWCTEEDQGYKIKANANPERVREVLNGE